MISVTGLRREKVLNSSLREKRAISCLIIDPSSGHQDHHLLGPSSISFHNTHEKQFNARSVLGDDENKHIDSEAPFLAEDDGQSSYLSA